MISLSPGLSAAAIGLVLTIGTVAAHAQDISAPKALATCTQCHGQTGDSPVATTPRLNGQQKPYLVERMGQFMTAHQKVPQGMSGMLDAFGNVSQQEKDAIADYFARQAPTPAKPGPGSAQGMRLFKEGTKDSRIIACVQCHGASGEGHDAVPRIAGQHRDYLESQLAMFASKMRGKPIMHPNTERMTRAEMASLASYLGSD